MNYPIFSAIVNQIETRLSKRAINVEQFRVWNEENINATGLEISLNLSDRSSHVKKLVINLDWDKFREAVLASQLPGMNKHPLLKSDIYTKSNISPHIDVELIWHLDEDALYRKLDSTVGNRRIEAARHWMEDINKELQRNLPQESLITRWHVEVEGDINGRYVTDMSLISYLQYQLDEFTTLNDIHRYLEEHIQKILLRTNTFIKIASKTMELAA